MDGNRGSVCRAIGVNDFVIECYRSVVVTDGSIRKRAIWIEVHGSAGWVGELVIGERVAVCITVVRGNSRIEDSVLVHHKIVVASRWGRIVDSPTECVGNDSAIAVIGSNSHGVRTALGGARVNGSGDSS